MLTREIFERKPESSPGNLKWVRLKIPWVSLNLSPKDERDIEEILKAYPDFKSLPRKHKGTYSEVHVGLDGGKEEVEFAGGFRKVSHEIVGDLFDFLGPGLKKPQYEFLAPTRAEELRFANKSPILFYFVPGYFYRKLHVHDFYRGAETIEKTVVAPCESQGENKRPFKVENDGQNSFLKVDLGYPVLVSTAQDAATLIEVPAAEMLHKAIADYTVRQIGDIFERGNLTSTAQLTALYEQFADFEEIVVHALTTLWLTSFNERKSILTPSELDNRIRKTDQHYYGVAQFRPYAKSLGEHGPQKTLEMFAESAFDLMRRAGVGVELR